MKRAIIYARFSPRRNADKCESVETQIELCSQFCQKEGYEISGIFFDKNLSGSDENRPGLWSAIEELKAGYVLMAYRLDRIARDEYLSYLIEQQVQKRKASIISISGEGTWGSSNEDWLIRRILQTLAEYERKVIAARTKTAMLRHQARGRRISSNPPFGFSVDPVDSQRLIEHSGEQATLSRIKVLKDNNCTLRAICRTLQSEGYKCRGSKWHHATIKRILNRTNLKTAHKM
ncbi:recombinase family protein [Candidatus Pacearchaeota archaeon]|nr:recombinase family protein [Candidatus Pacearchaeota archaeon]